MSQNGSYKYRDKQDTANVCSTDFDIWLIYSILFGHCGEVNESTIFTKYNSRNKHPQK